jgi:hypothetical protein
MGRISILAGTVVLCLLCSLRLQAQQSDSSASDNTNMSSSSQPAAGTVPRLIKFTGVVKDLTGKVPTGTVGLTFSLYELPEGGSPLWVETQSVPLDSQGRYTALLGANSPGGLPLDLFTTSRALWVGVQPQLPGQAEQPRVLLVAVPYSLKSSDADTLGGRPASAYVLSSNQSGVGESSITALVAPAAGPPRADARGDPPNSLITGNGTANYVPKFTGTYTIANSTIYSNAAGLVGIGNTNPAGTLDVSGGAFIRGALQMPASGAATKSSAFCSFPLDLQSSVFSSTTSAAVPQLFRWKAEPTGNNTTSPSAKLNLLFGSGTSTPGETGLSINSQGVIAFAPGQTFPGTGTVTSVGSGTGLTGGPITTSGTLSVNTSVIATNSSVATAVGAETTRAEGVEGSLTTSVNGITSSTLTLTAHSPLTGGGTFNPGTSASLTLGLNTSGLAQLGSANTFTAAQTLAGGEILPPTGTATAGVPYTSEPLDLIGSSWNGTSAVSQHFRWQTEGNGSAATGSLNLLYLSGAGTPGETGLSINGQGQITFATGQTFPGTVTSVGVNSGSGLQASPNPIRGTGTLSIASGGVTDGMLANYYSGVGSCTGGQVVSALNHNAAPTCVTAGTVTEVDAGNGLTGGPITTSGTLSLNPNISGKASSFTDSNSTQVLSVTQNGSGVALSATSSGGEASAQLGTAYTNTYGTSPVGVYGTAAGTASAGVYGTAAGTGAIAVYGNAPSCCYGVWGNSNTGVLGTSTAGAAAVWSDGDLVVSGGKAALVALPDNRLALLYAVESPENWFEDFGSGQLSEGVGEVALEPTFALSVNLEAGYHVFLTPKGDCEGLYVTNETPTGFQVRELRGGKSNVAFDYRIVAKRRGFESVRMEIPETDAATVQAVRETVQNRSPHRRLILHRPAGAPKAPLALPEAGAAPAALGLAAPRPPEPAKPVAPPKRSALDLPPPK